MMQGAVAVGVAGVTVLALPHAARAASVSGDVGPSAPPDPDPDESTDAPTLGLAWASSEATGAGFWGAVAYGNGVWVAVSSEGNRGIDGTMDANNRVMRSTNNGQTWTAGGSVAPSQWTGIATDGNGVWVAVAVSGPYRVMRSTNNGQTWSTLGITGVEDLQWASVAYGNGMWVAVSTFTSNRVMYSTNGQDWTAVDANATGGGWTSVAYGNGVWVAVSGGGQVMRGTSDGQIWTTAGISGVAAKSWMSVTTNGNGVWVAVSYEGDVMRSTNNGLTWTTQGISGVAAKSWLSVTYGGGVWVAVAEEGDVMRSTNNGASWTPVAAPEINYWNAVAYGDSTFVAVALTDFNPSSPVLPPRTNLVMRSSMS
jgi:hypothetical protein